VVSVLSARPSLCEVLLDLGLLVEQVQVRAGPAGDHLGPEGARSGILAAPDLAAEDYVDLVRPADVDVVADQLLEEDPPRQGPVQRHGGGELDLLDRQLPAVVRVLIVAGERVRQPGQPLAGEAVDLLIGQPVAGPLHRGRVAGRAERVVQGGEADPRTAAARLEQARTAWDAALAAIDAARAKQTAAPGLQEPAKEALATLEREWDGLAAHRDYPMVSLDNYPDVAVMPMFAGGGGSAAGQGGALAA